MGYIVIARKYRPRCFADVVGQEGVTDTLSNAIIMDRVGHAYLFSGPRGVGKTTVARLFSMALNCVDGPTEKPCGTCPSCTDVYQGRDVDVMEIDGASNRGIDEIRAIRENAVYSPSRSRYRIFIIDEVHMLTMQAFNALLKILEEPPAHVKFLFATTRPQNIPDTIRSRCQRFDFRPVARDRIAGRLDEICKTEKVDVDEEVFEAVARRANGSMRDAQSLLDQLLSMGGGGERICMTHLESMLGWIPLAELKAAVETFARGDVPGALGIVEGIFEGGRDPAEFLLQLQEYLRDLLLAKASGGRLPVAAASVATEKDLAPQLELFERDELLYILQVVHHLRRELRRDIEGRILLETALVRLATVKELAPLTDVIAKVRTRALDTAGPAPAPGPAAAKPSLGAVAEAWPAVVDLLKKSHGWASYLADAIPVKVDGKDLHLGFPSDREFHREQIERDSRRREIAQAVAQLTGFELDVVLVPRPGRAGDVFEGISPDRLDYGAPPDPGAEKAPIVRKALDIFKGSIVDASSEKGGAK
jgi:DNA polymerase-3 subunit gamma/tau